MAVFPDRIVLKNSTDSQAAIEAAIESGGTDEITQGEIVLGLASGSAEIYTKDANGSIVTISGSGGGGGSGSRTSANNTTASIADAASADMTITGTGKTGQLLSIETSHAAWVTVYASQATRTADSGRAETTDPAPGSGVLAEVITTGAETILITPCVNHFNDETVVADELYLKVVNKSGSAATITVTLKVMPTES